MKPSALAFLAFLAALDAEGHHTGDRAGIAQLIADALETVSPDSAGQQDIAERMAVSFAMLAEDLREARDAHAEWAFVVASRLETGFTVFNDNRTAANQWRTLADSYAARVAALEASGMTTSDAQATVDVDGDLSARLPDSPAASAYEVAP